MGVLRVLQRKSIRSASPAMISLLPTRLSCLTCRQALADVRLFNTAILRFIGVVLVSVSILTIALQSQQPRVPESWPQFRGNASLTGVSQSAVPASLKVAWTYEAGEPIESSAAIADGVVYVGAQSAELLALELKSGKLLWKYNTTEGI